MRVRKRRGFRLDDFDRLVADAGVCHDRAQRSFYPDLERHRHQRRGRSQRKHGDTGGDSNSDGLCSHGDGTSDDGEERDGDGDRGGDRSPAGRAGPRIARLSILEAPDQPRRCCESRCATGRSGGLAPTTALGWDVGGENQRGAATLPPGNAGGSAVAGDAQRTIGSHTGAGFADTPGIEPITDRTASLDTRHVPN